MLRFLIKPDILHARPAAELIKTAKNYGCLLYVKTVEGWREAGIMNLLLLTSGSENIEMGLEGDKTQECLDNFNKLFTLEQLDKEGK